MRPVRLELHGFTAFRDEVVVDFSAADLFALTGPTGAGKSSLIDGMCFALYGSVPRLDRRTVAPVISSGKMEARIRFDFTVGTTELTAVRVVRRSPRGGATTKEARLERAGETLAGDADGVTAAVERILGLGFEQFTKCVVLPQGDFARFLHDKPSGRQELLVRLLELDVYERMRGEANGRRVAADAAADALARQVDALAAATPEALESITDRVERLTGLRDEVDQALPRLEELERVRDAARARADVARANAELLGAVAVPDDVDALASAVTSAEEQHATAHTVVTAAEDAVARAETARQALGDHTQLTTLRDTHARRRDLTERVAKGQPIVAERRAAEERAQRHLTTAVTAAAGSAEELESARREHAAHAIAATLEAGQPCPVCLQTVKTLPAHVQPAALNDAEAATAATAAERDAAEKALQPLRDQRVKAEQHLEDLTAELALLRRRLADAPAEDDIARRLSDITAAEAALTAAREHERTARAAARAAAEELSSMQRRRDGAWQQFDTMRDRVAALDPPAVTRDDIAAAWQHLAAWAAEHIREQRDAAQAAQAAAESAVADLGNLHDKLAARCEECEVVVDPGRRLRDAVADALATAQADHGRVTQQIQQAEQLRGELNDLRDRSAVAGTLAKHLSARGFEQWLLDEALTRLAVGASDVLRELSGGQYSLALDSQRNFVVVDHRNADEERPARTLSGGETFLASLALALTLAEHLTQLAVGAQPRLESIFLDEGFGTLDPETQDVVAAAIEELGARGRTVGIVTHVRELADRMPVRYEVRKAPSGSTVERVER